MWVPQLNQNRIWPGYNSGWAARWATVFTLLMSILASNDVWCSIRSFDLSRSLSTAITADKERDPH